MTPEERGRPPSKPASTLEALVCAGWLLALVIGTTMAPDCAFVIVVVAVPGVLLTFEGFKILRRRSGY